MAIVFRTQKRSALDNPPFLLSFRNREQRRRPLPNVAAHIDQSVAIGRKTADRRGPEPAVGLLINPRERTLPDIR